MRIMTASEEAVFEGGRVETFQLSNGEKIPAIVVGESGRGRSLGVVPVSLKRESFEQWKTEGSVLIKGATVGQTRTGRPKLIESEESESSKVIAVMFTPIGFRGDNSHQFPEEAEVLTSGRIAQGDAGRMGMGEQYIVVLPVPCIVRVHIGGRRYGAPTDYVYHFEEKEFFVRTGDEEELIDGTGEQFVVDEGGRQ